MNDAGKIAGRVFAKTFACYLRCCRNIQEAVKDMVDIVNDPDATEQETDAALLTISDALFPTGERFPPRRCDVRAEIACPECGVVWCEKCGRCECNGKGE